MKSCLAMQNYLQKSPHGWMRLARQQISRVFRPGKVPAAVVKARFGDQVKGEVIRTALDDAAKDAIETNELKLASQPRLDIVSFEDGKDLVAKLMAEVMPEITIPDLSTLDVERPTMSVAKEEIDATLQRLADENRPTTKVETKRKAKKQAMLC